MGLQGKGCLLTKRGAPASAERLRLQGKFRSDVRDLNRTRGLRIQLRLLE